MGDVFKGTLGLLAKHWRKIISPIVAASVVTSIGIGFTAASEIELWHAFPPMIQSVFSANVVCGFCGFHLPEPCLAEKHGR